MSSEAGTEKQRPQRKAAAKNKRGGWWFLLGAILLYIVLGFFDRALVGASLQHFVGLLKTIAPILLLVMLFMWIIDVLIAPATIKKYMGHESGWKGWAISIIAGILSHGPVYAWYPLLQSLQQSGTRPALIATFLYARSIKLPWLPMLAFYFGTPYMIAFSVFLILFAPVVGWVTERSSRARGQHAA
jgi:uncharacterized membrane protein YraQ (UPF0718 family)